MKRNLRRGWPGNATTPPSARTRSDWALAAAVVVAAVLEVALRPDMLWRPVGLAVGMVLAATMMWRRTHAPAMVAVAFGTFAALDVASIVDSDGAFFFYTGGFVLILVYALLRWATKPQAVLGMGIALLELGVSTFTDFTGAQDAVGGLITLLLAAALGLSMRYRAIIAVQQFERIRSHERADLGRELHDTVAHHVSAIAIQAQAGQFLASTHNLEGASEALRVIEHEASTALTEMRSIVGTLRSVGDAPHLSAAHTLSDIDALASPRGQGSGPNIEVERRGNLEGLLAPVQAALFRVAQESLTNALRHANAPEQVRILLDGTGRDVQMSITDDGQRLTGGTSPPGFGTTGMQERAALLGGTLCAGPAPGGGWRVETTIPRRAGAA